MNSKKRLLKISRLYIILDKEVLGRRCIFDIANAVKNSQVCVVQYRDKKSKKDSILRNALRLRKLFSKTNTVFIVNDYIDIAKIADSNGIHLGQSDLKVETARKILGKDKIIGISCHNLKQAKEAQAKGADYIGVGPIYSSPTKPEYKAIGLEAINKIRKHIKIPFFVIGGINQSNVKEVLASGAKRIAVCRAICQVKNTRQTLKNLYDTIRIRKK